MRVIQYQMGALSREYADSSLAVRMGAALSLCAYLSLCTVNAVAQAQSPAQAWPLKQPPSEISGHVVRADTGAPVAKASVSLCAQDERTSRAADNSRVTRSGADGSFAFHDVPAGSYAIRVHRNGFAQSRTVWELNSKSFQVRPGQQLDNFTLQLIPAGIITGKLVDEDLEPVAAVGVDVVRVEFLPGGLRQIYLTARAVSDDQGNFRVASLPPGSYYVRAGGLIQQLKFQVALKEGPGGGAQYRETYFPGTALLNDARPVEVRPEQESKEIRIQLAAEKTFTISGAIQGEPPDSKLKPTELGVEKRSVAQQMWSDRSYWLRDDGTYTLRMFSPGDYTLTAVAIRQDKGNQIATLVPEGFAVVSIVDSDVRADIQLGRAGEVRGQVDAPAGFSFAGKQIILQTTGMEYYPADLDSAGRFEARNVPPGEYTISILDKKSRIQRSYIKQALCSGRDLASQPVELTLDAVLDCRITVGDDAGSVRGQVNDRDAHAAGRIVAVLIPQSRALRRMPRYTVTAKSDSAGRYTIAGVIPGDYFLFAVSPSDTHEYFALDFAERNVQDAIRVTVAARATQDVDAHLHLSKAR